MGKWPRTIEMGNGPDIEVHSQEEYDAFMGVARLNTEALAGSAWQRERDARPDGQCVYEAFLRAGGVPFHDMWDRIATRGPGSRERWEAFAATLPADYIAAVRAYPAEPEVLTGAVATPADPETCGEWWVLVEDGKPGFVTDNRFVSRKWERQGHTVATLSGSLLRVALKAREPAPSGADGLREALTKLAERVESISSTTTYGVSDFERVGDPLLTIASELHALAVPAVADLDAAVAVLSAAPAVAFSRYPVALRCLDSEVKADVRLAERCGVSVHDGASAVYFRGELIAVADEYGTVQVVAEHDHEKARLEQLVEAYVEFIATVPEINRERDGG